MQRVTEREGKRRRAEIIWERMVRERRDCRQRNQREGKRRRVGRKKLGAQGRSPWLPGHVKMRLLLGIKREEMAVANRGDAAGKMGFEFKLKWGNFCDDGGRLAG